MFACIKADGTSRACMPAHQSDVDHRLRDMGIPRRWGQRYACVHACKTLQCGFSLRDTVYQDSAYSEPVPLALEHSKNGCAVSPPGVGSSKIVRSFFRWHSNDLGSRSNAHERLAVAFALCQPNRPGQIAHAAPCHSCTHLCGGHGKYVGFPCNAFGSSCNRIHCWSTSWPWDSLILPLLHAGRGRGCPGQATAAGSGGVTARSGTPSRLPAHRPLRWVLLMANLRAVLCAAVCIPSYLPVCIPSYLPGKVSWGGGGLALGADTSISSSCAGRRAAQGDGQPGPRPGAFPAAGGARRAQQQRSQWRGRRWPGRPAGDDRHAP